MDDKLTILQTFC